MKTKLEYRFAKAADLRLLARWNHQLIRDEGHRNPMTIAQLMQRMSRWLHSDEYRAVLFSFGRTAVAYALYKEDVEEIYLRHLFVRRDRRSEGIGAAAMDILLTHLWPKKRLTVEVMSVNPRAIEFYRHLGYQDYCLKMEILPPRR